MRQKEGKIQIVAKFLVAYLVLAGMLTLVFSVAFYLTFSRSAFNTLRQHVLETAAAVAESTDFTGIDALVDPSQEDDPNYRRIYGDLLYATQVQPNLEFIYTMRPRENGEWEFVIDAAEPEEDENDNGKIDDDEANADIGEFYDVECCPELVAGFDAPSADKEITSDIWGSWVSGYAPIQDETGETVGIVGVDVSVDELLAQQALVRKLIAITLSITLLLSLFFGGVGVFMFWVEAQAIQRALEIRNVDLERKVKSRTRALRDFMSMIVHELRSPLTALRWSIETLRDMTSNTKKEEERFDQMDSIAEDMLGLVNQFLDVSKLTVGKFQIVKEKGDFPKLIKSLAKRFEPEAKGLKLKMNIEIAFDIPKFAFDKKRITQVVNNLVSNALKYTKKGSVTLKLTYEQDTQRVRLCVIDTGAGVTKADLKKLYQPFVRVGSKKQVGAGLGLAITKGIVEAHGGVVGVDSEVGKGSSFWFELPAK